MHISTNIARRAWVFAAFLATALPGCGAGLNSDAEPQADGSAHSNGSGVHDDSGSAPAVGRGGSFFAAIARRHETVVRIGAAYTSFEEALPNVRYEVVGDEPFNLRTVFVVGDIVGAEAVSGVRWESSGDDEREIPVKANDPDASLVTYDVEVLLSGSVAHPELATHLSDTAVLSFVLPADLDEAAIVRELRSLGTVAGLFYAPRTGSGLTPLEEGSFFGLVDEGGVLDLPAFAGGGSPISAGTTVTALLSSPERTIVVKKDGDSYARVDG